VFGSIAVLDRCGRLRFFWVPRAAAPVPRFGLLFCDAGALRGYAWRAGLVAPGFLRVALRSLVACGAPLPLHVCMPCALGCSRRLRALEWVSPRYLARHNCFCFRIRAPLHWVLALGRLPSFYLLPLGGFLLPTTLILGLYLIIQIVR